MLYQQMIAFQFASNILHSCLHLNLTSTRTFTLNLNTNPNPIFNLYPNTNPPLTFFAHKEIDFRALQKQFILCLNNNNNSNYTFVQTLLIFLLRFKCLQIGRASCRERV